MLLPSRIGSRGKSLRPHGAARVNLGLLTSIVLEDGTFVAFGPTYNVDAARELVKR